MAKKFSFSSGLNEENIETEQIDYSILPEKTEVEIPIDLIEIGENIRNVDTDDDLGLEELGDSIKEHGQIQPCKVFRKGNKFILKVGSRRYKACLMQNIKTLKCIIEESFENEKDRIIKQAIENEQRTNMSSREREEYIARLLELGMSQIEIANTLHKSKSWVSTAIQAHQIAEENKDLFKNLNEEPSTRDTYYAGKLPTSELKKVIDETKKEGGTKESFKKNLNDSLKKNGIKKNTLENNKIEEEITQENIDSEFGIEDIEFEIKEDNNLNKENNNSKDINKDSLNSEEYTLGLHFTYTINDKNKSVKILKDENDLDSDIEKFIFEKVKEYYKSKGYHFD